MALIYPGNRLQQLFDVAGEGGGAKWFGGGIGELEPDGRIPVGWDDGDLKLLTAEEVVYLYEKSELCACTTDGGLVKDDAKPTKATALCMLKNGSERFPVGVLLTEGNHPALAGYPVYHSHIVNTTAVVAALEGGNPTRPTRGRGSVGKHHRGGYHTFRRGDRLVYVGEDNDTHATIEAISFGLLIAEYGKKSQQLRFIISFDSSAHEFSVSSWDKWKRVFTGDDPDLSPSVSVASSDEVNAMALAWSATRTTLETKASTIDKLRKLAALGPPSLREIKEAALAEAARARKAKVAEVKKAKKERQRDDAKKLEA